MIFKIINRGSTDTYYDYNESTRECKLLIGYRDTDCKYYILQKSLMSKLLLLGNFTQVGNSKDDSVKYRKVVCDYSVGNKYIQLYIELCTSGCGVGLLFDSQLSGIQKKGYDIGFDYDKFGYKLFIGVPVEMVSYIMDCESRRNFWDIMKAFDRVLDHKLPDIVTFDKCRFKGNGISFYSWSEVDYMEALGLK